MFPLSTLASVLKDHPVLAAALDIESLNKFIHLVSILKPLLLIRQPSYDPDPPEHLPANIHDFLKISMDFSDDMTKLAWQALRFIAWEVELNTEDLRNTGKRYIQLFVDHGECRGIAFYNICPPTRVCIDPSCTQKTHKNSSVVRSRDLVEAVSIAVTVFTQDFGPIPGQATSTYCRQCKTRYHANYYVHDQASIRTYYSGPFDFIQVAQHVFIATCTCELFATMMVTAWTSATNCARIYNYGLATNSATPCLPAAYSKSLVLDVEDVWNALFLHWLLKDCEERGTFLQLDHTAPSQADRLRPALHARNLRISGPGQEAWNHACDSCCWIEDSPDGPWKVYLRSVVIDGVTIGRPCCAVQDCFIPLPSQRHKFCPEHQDKADECAVTSCTARVEAGYRTCPEPSHRQLEDYNNMKNKAMFQLKHRLARLKVLQPEDASNGIDEPADGSQGSAAHIDEEVLIDDGKSEKGNRTVRARFGRRRTHNEELCVASCGVILGRATFYGSEAPNGVRTFLMRLFPTKKSLPGVIWHDNNCRIRAMLRNDEDPTLRTYFDHCALPVDVFHFKSKHKESDIDCGTYCNPYIWPELHTKQGTWRFNSSAAEQANAWFGGYQAIVREMQVDRYEFFLDEMIKRRNISTIKELKRRLKAPYSIPRHILLPPDNGNSTFH